MAILLGWTVLFEQYVLTCLTFTNSIDFLSLWRTRYKRLQWPLWLNNGSLLDFRIIQSLPIGPIKMCVTTVNETMQTQAHSKSHMCPKLAHFFEQWFFVGITCDAEDLTECNVLKRGQLHVLRHLNGNPIFMDPTIAHKLKARPLFQTHIING